MKQAHKNQMLLPQFAYKKIAVQCLMAMGLMAANVLDNPAQAVSFDNVNSTMSVDRVGSKGSKGKNGKKVIVMVGRGSPGESGGEAEIIRINLMKNATINQYESRPAISANSLGGEGGEGGKSAAAYWDAAGGTGGKGGNVFLDTNGSTIINHTANSAISLKSQGGRPGLGYNLGSPDRAHGGAGGSIMLSDFNADTVVKQTAITASVYPSQTINRNQNGRNLIDVRSVGGKGIKGSEPAVTQTREDGSPGGAGGNVTGNLSGQYISSQSASAVMYFLSQGGQGGELDSRGNHRSGLGGTAGNVSVTTSGSVTSPMKVMAKAIGRSMLEYSDGIVAESIAGNAGDVVEKTLAYRPSGGHGGRAGDVSVNIRNTQVQIQGTHSRGIVARSIGGNAYAGSPAVFAGSPGIGGNAGNVRVEVDANSHIEVGVQNDGRSFDNTGIYAVSAGGGGADGSTGLFVGTSGSQGGKAGNVNVEHSGAMDVYGKESVGIYAASLGGNAGNGGKGFGVVGFGGKGGKASDAGNVSVTVSRSGRIDTYNDSSTAILAQSIGGGGGDIDSTTVEDYQKQSGTNATAVHLGGDSSNNSSNALGGSLSVNNEGKLHTRGNDSDAILVQSIGGGGGSGGGAVGIFALGGKGAAGSHGGNIRIAHSGSIETEGEYSSGIQASSIGGGGGDGGKSLAFSSSLIPGIPPTPAIAIGGSGGVGAKGGDINAVVSGSILTRGNHSSGVQLTSIGGGGGNGGDASALTVLNLWPSVTIGGSGASGAHAGKIDYNSEFSKERILREVAANVEIQTQGSDADAISIKSIGGGGGDGGNVSATTVLGLSAISVGGRGGSNDNKANGGEVKLTNVHKLTTLGHGSRGIYVQSIGGGGGNGGKASSKTLGIPINQEGDSVGSAIAVGGFSGGGGNAGAININNHADVFTLGHSATGIGASSIGGGGGSGGSASAEAIVVSPGKAFNFTASIGGKGGNGGNGSDVTVKNHNVSIMTMGQLADGIEAESIGSGGGNGGMGASKGFSAAPESYSFSANLGGFGGGGGSAGNVTIDNAGQVVTVNTRSRGLVARSIGGGGGEGNIATGDSTASKVNVNLNIGGKGGNGGSGGKVTILNSGQIVTYGRESDAILALSVGGGGGDGGSAGSSSQSELSKLTDLATQYVDSQLVKQAAEYYQGSTSKEDSKSVSVGLTLGGMGGKGGRGGDVNVSTTTGSQITTFGDRASAIMAMSVGGGGGKGGNASGKSRDGDVSVSLSLGGLGSSGNEGGMVDVSNHGEIRTEGIAAHGLFLQSIGGGGGVAGSSQSENSANKVSVNLTLGGLAGNGSQGGQIKAENTNQIVANNGHAIFAQSIGGGGGDAGSASSKTVLKADDKKSATNPSAESEKEQEAKDAQKSKTVNVGINLGGLAGAGAKGGAVTINNSGKLYTGGELNSAIFAQSIGGGGGNGGASTAEQGGGNVAVNLAVGGWGREGGAGGNIIIKNDGQIQTSGDLAYGIHSQSIGGGGGKGGATTSANKDSDITVGLKLGGLAGGGQKGGTVDVTNKGQIVTQGEDAHAIYLQSIGGGGGSAGNVNSKVTNKQINVKLDVGGIGGNGADGGLVKLDNTGNVLTAQGMGLVLQSIGGGGGDGGSVNGSDATAKKEETKKDDSKKDDSKKDDKATQTASTDSKDDSKADNPKKVRVGLSIGGLAGSGGNGGEVKVNNQGILQTGDTAILAQSIGGGGGNGGATDSGATGGDVNVGLNVGGLGRSGGKGGLVTLTNSGAIQTSGDMAYGIQAQSIAGGGGKGGSTTSATGNATVDVNLSIGGKGASSVAGGAVDVTNKGQIVTQGEDAHAIYLQSIGGGGGSAGNVNSKVTNKQINVKLDVGGIGGNGADGGLVKLDNTGNVLTAQGMGLVLQSIGGGGGDGGSVNGSDATAKKEETKKDDSKKDDKATQTASTDSKDDSKADNPKKVRVGLSIGGLAGSGGNGGEVKVNNQGILQTGDTAILAQSIGGGGGNGGATDSGATGGDVNVNINIGSNGNVGGNGGSVSIFQNGQIETALEQAHALVAQSIGGGGGNASSIMRNGQAEKLALALNMGANGGKGGVGGWAKVTNVGEVVTKGDESFGVLAQSIGGGGGQSSLIQNLANSTTANLNVNVGGHGGTGGRAGNAQASNNKTVLTHGNASHGVVAQSIGGGGGVANLGGGHAQNGTLQLDVTVGGSGGIGGAAGNVWVRNDQKKALILTEGDASYGILAQSIGGGGGYVNLPQTSGNSMLSGQLQIGGEGGSGNVGSAVEISNSGHIETWGNNSHAIVGQSIGGGGGIVNAATQNTANGIAVNIHLGSKGGTGADGGDVDIHNNGDVLTKGNGAYGVLAQSIGGGGGFAAQSFANLNVLNYSWQHALSGNLNSSAQGESGRITVHHEEGNIVTTGDNSVGIFAQTRSNSLNVLKPKNNDITIGLGSQENPDDDNVSFMDWQKPARLPVPKLASIQVQGQNSVGIFAQNRATQTGVPTGNIAINLAENTSVAAAENSEAIVLDGGLNNRITSNGQIIAQINANAIRLIPHLLSTLKVENSGVIQGNMQLNHRATVRNLEDGRLITGRLIDLGSSQTKALGTLYNLGSISPMGTGNIGETVINGHYQQTNHGRFIVDVNFAKQQQDVLNIQGDTRLGGEIYVNVLDEAGPVLNQAFTVLTTNGVVTATDVKISSDVYLMDYNRTWLDMLPGQKGLSLTATGLKFNEASLNKDQQSIADYLDNSVSGDSSDYFKDANDAPPVNARMASVTTLASKDKVALQDASTNPSQDENEAFDKVYQQAAQIKSLAQYRSFLNNIVSDTKQSSVILAPLTTYAFVNKMMSCPSNSFINDEESCVWIDVRRDYGKHSGDFEDLGYQQKSWITQVGTQKEIAPNWFVGGSFAYQDSIVEAEDVSVKTNTNAYHLGLFGKHINGPWQFGLALNANYATNETNRIMILPLETHKAQSKWDSYFASLTWRMAYETNVGPLQIKPTLDATIFYQNIPAYQESGAGIYNLVAEKQSKWNGMLSPSIDLTYTTQRNDWVIRPYASVGLHYLIDNEWEMESRLQGADKQDSMVLSTSLSSIIGSYKVGMDLFKNQQWDMKFEYEFKQGSDYTGHSGRIRAAYHF